MLLELTVKDIALVKKASVSFGEGLNILTGETGTGKSVIIDSAMLALGARTKGDIIRRGAESAYVELLFGVEPDVAARLSELGIHPDEDGLLIISRKLLPGRSISKINDETVTLAKLREAAALLLDIYGQNEFHTLLDKRSHLRILDAYLGAAAKPLLQETAEAYAHFRKAKARAESMNLDEQERLRQMDLLRFELDEIDGAALADGEEEDLAARYKRLSNARDILEHLNTAHGILSDCDTGRAVSELERALHYDTELDGLCREMLDAQSVLESVLGGIRDYADGLELDEGVLHETEERLDLIRRLELKYGHTIGDILAYRDAAAEKLRSMEDYEEQKADAGHALREAERGLEDCCQRLSAVRQQGAERLCENLIEELGGLGFDRPQIRLQFEKKTPGADGYDDTEFFAALNPGEAEKPLSEVASGGELSRVMLAIKTILAETDEMPTLIFDEIDTGISGRTAQKVAEKLDIIGTRHQVICVSHLPQIAAMADVHFVIRKTEADGRNVTEIERLDEAGSCGELARLLGGAEITRAVSENAQEMRRLALERKNKRRTA